MDSEETPLGAIPEDCHLLRRLDPGRAQYDAEIGRVRPNSDVFRTDELSMSIQEERPTRSAAGDLLQHPYPGYESTYVVRLALADVQKHNLPIKRDPVLDEANNYDNDPAHVLVLGKKTKKIALAMAYDASWVVPPEPPLEPPR